MSNELPTVGTLYGTVKSTQWHLGNPDWSSGSNSVTLVAHRKISNFKGRSFGQHSNFEQPKLRPVELPISPHEQQSGIYFTCHQSSLNSMKR